MGQGNTPNIERATTERFPELRGEIGQVIIPTPPAADDTQIETIPSKWRPPKIVGPTHCADDDTGSQCAPVEPADAESSPYATPDSDGTPKVTHIQKDNGIADDDVDDTTDYADEAMEVEHDADEDVEGDTSWVHEPEELRGERVLEATGGRKMPYAEFEKLLHTPFDWKDEKTWTTPSANVWKELEYCWICYRYNTKAVRMPRLGGKFAPVEIQIAGLRWVHAIQKDGTEIIFQDDHHVPDGSKHKEIQKNF